MTSSKCDRHRRGKSRKREKLAQQIAYAKANAAYYRKLLADIDPCAYRKSDPGWHGRSNAVALPG